jgi:hypothetical protein
MPIDLPRPLPAAAIVALILLAIIPCVATAQRASDSAAIDRAIRLERSDLPFAASARMLLLRRLRQGDARGGRSLLVFMGRRPDDAATWLTARERLLAETIIADTLLVRERERMTSLLATAAISAKQNLAYDDRLFESERDLLRESVDAVAARFDENDPTPAERTFYNLLINQLFTRGYRAQEKINDRVDAFAGAYPASPLVPIAREYLKKAYGETDFGAAFMAGYAFGGFDGGLGRRFDLFYGPSLSGELYLYRITIAGVVTFGNAVAPQPFTAGGEQWLSGSQSFINLALDGGYELRFGRLAITPLLGLAGQAIRGADSAGSDPAALPRTNVRLGYDLGAIIGYRIPFDVGPHLDLRVQGGRAAVSFDGYDPSLSGSLWYIRLGFALIQRPYEGR